MRNTLARFPENVALVFEVQRPHWGARPQDYVTARDALVGASGALSPSWTAELEQDWRAAITAIVVPMLEGAAVYTATEAERLAGE